MVLKIGNHWDKETGFMYSQKPEIDDTGTMAILSEYKLMTRLNTLISKPEDAAFRCHIPLLIFIACEIIAHWKLACQTAFHATAIS